MKTLPELLRIIIDHVMGRVKWLGLYEYRVVDVDAELARFDLQPVAKLGLPDLLRVFVRPGTPGTKGAPILGTFVNVQFVNGDPARPVVTGFAGPETDSDAVPTEVHLDASSNVRIGQSAGSVRIGESATLVHIGSGRTAMVSPASDGHPVLYGDIVILGSEFGPIQPGGGQTVSKVRLG